MQVVILILFFLTTVSSYGNQEQCSACLDLLRQGYGTGCSSQCSSASQILGMTRCDWYCSNCYYCQVSFTFEKVSSKNISNCIIEAWFKPSWRLV